VRVDRDIKSCYQVPHTFGCTANFNIQRHILPGPEISVRTICILLPLKYFQSPLDFHCDPHFLKRLGHEMVHRIPRFDSRDLCLHNCVQIGSVDHPTSYLTDISVLPPEVRSPCSARVKNEWIYSPTALQAFRTLCLIEQKNSFIYFYHSIHKYFLCHRIQNVFKIWFLTSCT
jgi:hypothetical protein